MQCDLLFIAVRLCRFGAVLRNILPNSAQESNGSRPGLRKLLVGPFL
jgi:hypothetical protein